MPRDPLSTSSILDEATEAVSRGAAPWLAAVWLTALPVRLLQVHFFREALALGRAAAEYGDYLRGLSLTMLVAFLLSLYGRAAYVRACRLSLQSGRVPGREALRLPAAQLACYVYTALSIEILFFALMWTLAAVPVLVLLAGLAAASSHRLERPGLLQPWREISRSSGSVKNLLALIFVFGIAFLIVWVNLYLAIRAGLWLMGGIGGGGVDLAAWSYLMRPNPHFLLLPAELLPTLLTLAGASLVVEPFWLASLTVYEYRFRVSETGEDLRQWFHSIQEGAR